MPQIEEILRLPPPYYLFRLLSGSDHMHFGWFRTREEDPHAAQDHMMELNLFGDPGGERVLDIGTGLGATAIVLAKRGYRVESVSPDRELVEYAIQRAAEAGLSDRVGFHIKPFQDYTADAPFDWVLFQESFQYFPDPVATLRQAVSFLRPGGRLQIGDQFLTVDVSREVGRFHYLPRIQGALKEAGLREHSSFDVSGAALHTNPRMLTKLKAAAPELVAQYKAQKPDIETDVHNMLTCAQQEWDATVAGHLRYVLMTYDVPGAAPQNG